MLQKYMAIPSRVVLVMSCHMALIMFALAVGSARQVLLDGDDAILTCTVSSIVYPGWTGPDLTGSITFYTHGGSPQINPNLGEKSNRLSWDPQNNKSLILRDVVKNDSGVYACFDRISPIMTHTISIRVKPHIPEILNTDILEDGSIVVCEVEDQHLILTCTSKGGFPKPTLQWFRNNNQTQSLSSTETHKVNEEGLYTVVLAYTFTPSRQDDRTMFLCQSSFQPPRPSYQTVEAKLYLRLKPLAPTITTYTVEEGISGRVARCAANQYRPDNATILFQINGENVTYVPHVTVTENIATETYSVSAEFNTVVDRNGSGNTASCSISHDTLQTPIVVFDTITVNYAPDVVVNTTNVTVYDTALLSCLPTGMPAIYTYTGWNHIWPGHGVVRTNRTLGHSPTLSMSRLTYEYSGIYECSVTNGVTGSLNPNAGYGAAYLDVGTFPIITTASPIQMHVTSQTYASISIDFYSNRQDNLVECYRNSTRFNCATFFQDVDIVLPLFDATVRETGTSAKVFFSVEEIDNSGEIVVKIINDVGESRINVNVVYREDVPAPTNNGVLIGAIVGCAVVVVVCVVVSIVVIIVCRRQASMENKQESVSTNRKDLQTPVPIEIEMESIDGDNANIEKNVYEELGERNEDVHEYGDVSRGHEGGGRGASADISYENLQIKP